MDRDSGTLPDLKKTYFCKEFLLTSGSQPECRGTQGCCEQVLGVLPNIGLTYSLLIKV